MSVSSDPLLAMKNIRYHIYRPGDPISLPQQNVIYEAWKHLWRDLFARVGQPEALNPDEFFRQDLIVCLESDGSLIGFHLYTFFDLDWSPARDHSYFKSIDPQTVIALRNRQIRRMMAMEYLSVLPEWRKRSVGLSMSEIIVALGLRLMLHTEAEAAIGTARTDVKVDQSVMKVGFTAIDQPIVKYEYPCQLVLCQRSDICPHPDQKTEAMIEDLWVNRIDTTQQTPQRNLKVHFGNFDLRRGPRYG